MNVIIIGNKDDTKLIKIDKFRKTYPDIEFTISEDTVPSTKDDLIIIMKELNEYNIPGKKSIFLESEIDVGNNFFLKSFDKIDVNINKIKLLIDIFLD